MTPEPDFLRNYFNYFTEVEEHFQRARGTALFLMSPLDWALVESWKNGGVPLEAVLRGIDAAFEKWRGRRVKTQMVNSLAFCAQAVLTEAQAMAGQPDSARAPRSRAAVFAGGSAHVSGGQRRGPARRLPRNRRVSYTIGRRGRNALSGPGRPGTAVDGSRRENDRRRPRAPKRRRLTRSTPPVRHPITSLPR